MQSHPLFGRRFGKYSASLGVTGRWGLLSHAQNAVRWLALSIRQLAAHTYHLLVHFKLLRCTVQLVLQRHGLSGINRMSSLRKKRIKDILSLQCKMSRLSDWIFVLRTLQYNAQTHPLTMSVSVLSTQQSCAPHKVVLFHWYIQR